MLTRFKSAARILLKGDPGRKKRNSIPAITPEEVVEIKQFFPREKFFIFGHARSGTTLLMRLARLHPEVHCNYQAHFFTRQPLLKSLVNTPEAEKWLTRKSNRWNRGRDLSKFLSAEDRRIIEDLRKDQDQFTNGTRSIFTETFIRRVAAGWVRNLQETEDEGRNLFEENYFGMRYEDLLTHPFDEMQKLWSFLGAHADPSLEKVISEEMTSNPDEEWQSKRNEGIASFLPKGQAGNWQRLFTKRDKSLFKEIAGEILVRWNYEKDKQW
jgi:hypothetical protein